MPSKNKLSLAVAALLFSGLACAFFAGEPPAAPASVAPPSATAPPTGTPTVAIPPSPTSPPPTATPVVCPALTDQIMIAALEEGAGEWEALDEEIYLTTYLVSGDELHDPYYEDVAADLRDEQRDEEAHRQVWNFFTALIPLDWRGDIGEYSIITDGRDGTLAAVAQTQDDPELWGLEVDVADAEDYYNLTFTLVHEFGHLLTLGPGQVPPNLAVFNNPDDDNLYFEEASKCPQYFPGEGCANADSYINAYYENFWAEIYEEWNEINLVEDEDAYYARLDDFYYKYEDRFVTDYAATNPEEDIAETWSFFVLGPKPTGGSIAEEKILFFYEYPELVELRAQILGNLCVSFPK